MARERTVSRPSRATADHPYDDSAVSAFTRAVGEAGRRGHAPVSLVPSSVARSAGNGTFEENRARVQADFEASMAGPMNRDLALVDEMFAQRHASAAAQGAARRAEISELAAEFEADQAEGYDFLGEVYPEFAEDRAAYETEDDAAMMAIQNHHARALAITQNVISAQHAQARLAVQQAYAWGPQDYWEFFDKQSQLLDAASEGDDEAVRRVESMWMSGEMQASIVNVVAGRDATDRQRQYVNDVMSSWSFSGINSALIEAANQGDPAPLDAFMANHRQYAADAISRAPVPTDPDLAVMHSRVSNALLASSYLVNIQDVVHSAATGRPIRNHFVGPVEEQGEEKSHAANIASKGFWGTLGGWTVPKLAGKLIGKVAGRSALATRVGSAGGPKGAAGGFVLGTGWGVHDFLMEFGWYEGSVGSFLSWANPWD